MSNQNMPLIIPTDLTSEMVSFKDFFTPLFIFKRIPLLFIFRANTTFPAGMVFTTRRFLFSSLANVLSLLKGKPFTKRVSAIFSESRQCSLHLWRMVLALESRRSPLYVDTDFYPATSKTRSIKPITTSSIKPELNQWFPTFTARTPLFSICQSVSILLKCYAQMFGSYLLGSRFCIHYTLYSAHSKIAEGGVDVN